MGITHNDNDDIRVKGDDGTSEGTPISAVTDGSLKRLAVDAKVTGTQSTGSITGSKLIYEEMNATHGGVARDAQINGTWTDVYSKTAGPGLLIGFRVTLEDETKWEIRLIIDGVEVMGANGLYTGDIWDGNIWDYKDNQSRNHLGIDVHGSTLSWRGPMQIPVTYSSSVVVKMRYTNGSKKFKAGLLMRTIP